MKTRWPTAGLCWVLGVGLWACSSTPPPPDWQLESQASLQRAAQAYLSGDTRVASVEFERARRELARTGSAEQVARAELSRCAWRLASLETLTADASSQCPGFEPLRADAAPAQLAYAAFLGGTLNAAQLALLPPQQQAAAAAGTDSGRREAAVRAIEDPLSRLLAAAAALRDGVAPPGLVALALDTASAQGWRRPLLAWLTFQIKRAEAGGDEAAAQALRRRVELLSGSQPAAAAPAAAASVPSR